MVIAIDGYEANVTDRVGIGRYAYEILKHLFAEIKGKSGILVRVYLPSPPVADMPQESLWWKYRVVRPKKLWTFIGLPLALVADRPAADIIFSPTHYAPRFVTILRVISIMDLSYLEYPSMFRKKDLHQLIHWTKYSVDHATKIFAISQFSKNAIIKRYGIEPRRVVVTYPGMTTLSNIKYQISNILEKYKLHKQYILSVGTLQPRKNYVRLIEAFARVVGQLKSQYPDLKLVIVGKSGWLYQDILAAPQKYGVADKVKFLNFVPDADLPGLYKNALCFALPSLYEGFGLPVLEAMAYGCPVVVSDVASLPEIAGLAGIYVQPNDVDSIAQGIITAIKERNTPVGKRRLSQGLVRSKKFTWEKAAKDTLAILEEVGKNKI